MTTRNLSGPRSESTKTASMPQPQTTRSRKSLRLALEDHVVGEIMPEATLERLERYCEEQNQEPAAAIAAAVESWLNGGSHTPQPAQAESSPALPSTHAASVFHDLYEEARESIYDNGITLFEGLLGLINGNPAFEQEFYALSLIVTGDRLLHRSPALEHDRRVNQSRPGEPETEQYRSTPHINVVQLGINRANVVRNASQSVVA